MISQLVITMKDSIGMVNHGERESMFGRMVVAMKDTSKMG